MRTPSDDSTPDGIWITPGGDDPLLDHRDAWAIGGWDDDPDAFDLEGHDRWAQKWAPPCPDGDPQRLAAVVGFRRLSLHELELRVPLGPADRGVCQVVVEERDDEVRVRVLVCYDERGEKLRSGPIDHIHWPVRIWLNRPLGERSVVDHDTDEELPLYVPDQ